jgi:hypothetical protein
MTSTTIVVMEPGSDWPGHIGSSTHIVAFSQGAEDLCRRTCETLDAIDRDRTNVRMAVLACNESTGGTIACDRALIARALLAAVRRTSHGRLVLSTNGRAPQRLLHDLLALADALTSEARGTTATVFLRFNKAHREPLALEAAPA